MVISMLAAGTVAFATAVFTVWRLCNPDSKFYIADVPNERSLHEIPKPRNGGWGVLAAIFVGWTVAALVGQPLRVEIGIGLIMVAIAVLGFMDDCFDLRAALRFGFQFCAAGAATILLGPVDSLQLPGGISLPLGYFAVPFTLLFIVWMINLYNFMDGMDGFAGGMSACGFGTFALLLFFASEFDSAAYVIVPASAMIGFVIFNFPPSRIFLGDAGSTSLGFLAAAYALHADRTGLWPLWVSVLIFSPFIIDATVTLLKRASRGERVWEPHRTHYYQRMVTSGHGHRNVVLGEYLLMGVCASAAIWVVLVPNCILKVSIGIAWILVFLTIAVLVDRHVAAKSLSQ